MFLYNCVSVCGHVLSLLLVKYMGINSLGYEVSYVFNFMSICHTFPQHHCAVLNSHQNYTGGKKNCTRALVTLLTSSTFGVFSLEF